MMTGSMSLMDWRKSAKMLPVTVMNLSILTAFVTTAFVTHIFVRQMLHSHGGWAALAGR